MSKEPFKDPFEGLPRRRLFKAGSEPAPTAKGPLGARPAKIVEKMKEAIAAVEAVTPGRFPDPRDPKVRETISETGLVIAGAKKKGRRK